MRWLKELQSRGHLRYGVPEMSELLLEQIDCGEPAVETQQFLDEAAEVVKSNETNESSWALAHPRNMKMGYQTLAAARATSRCLGRRGSVMSLTWELSAPRIVAFTHVEMESTGVYWSPCSTRSRRWSRVCWSTPSTSNGRRPRRWLARRPACKNSEGSRVPGPVRTEGGAASERSALTRSRITSSPGAPRASGSVLAAVAPLRHPTSNVRVAFRITLAQGNNINDVTNARIQLTVHMASRQSPGAHAHPFARRRIPSAAIT